MVIGAAVLVLAIKGREKLTARVPQAAVRAVARTAAWSLLVGLSFVAFTYVPHELADRALPPDSRARDVSSARTALLAWAGGVLAAVGAIYTARTYRLSVRGQDTERFSKAVEHIGSQTLEVRVGGIHALELIHRDSPTNRPPIADLLATFVRARTSGGGKSLEPDTQAALSVLGRTHFQGRRLNLSRLNLSGANLVGGNFTGATLEGTIFRGADLTDARFSQADLSRADLRGATVLRTNFDGARIDTTQFDTSTAN